MISLAVTCSVHTGALWDITLILYQGASRVESMCERGFREGLYPKSGPFQKTKEHSHVADEAEKTHGHHLFFTVSGCGRQAVVDLLVMRELLWSDGRSVTFSFIHDCLSSISISAGRHQQHRQDWRRTERVDRICVQYIQCSKQSSKTSQFHFASRHLDRVSTYPKATLKALADHVEGDGVDAGVDRCHVDADIVQHQKETRRDTKKPKRYFQRHTSPSAL